MKNEYQGILYPIERENIIVGMEIAFYHENWPEIYFSRVVSVDKGIRVESYNSGYFAIGNGTLTFTEYDSKSLDLGL